MRAAGRILRFVVMYLASLFSNHRHVKGKGLKAIMRLSKTCTSATNEAAMQSQIFLYRLFQTNIVKPCLNVYQFLIFLHEHPAWTTAPSRIPKCPHHPCSLRDRSNPLECGTSLGRKLLQQNPVVKTHAAKALFQRPNTWGTRCDAPPLPWIQKNITSALQRKISVHPLQLKTANWSFQSSLSCSSSKGMP